VSPREIDTVRTPSEDWASHRIVTSAAVTSPEPGDSVDVADGLGVADPLALGELDGLVVAVGSASAELGTAVTSSAAVAQQTTDVTRPGRPDKRERGTGDPRSTAGVGSPARKIYTHLFQPSYLSRPETHTDRRAAVTRRGLWQLGNGYV
jgi:hypothetical protein